MRAAVVPLLSVVALGGCVTTSQISPAVYDVRNAALVSLHARRDIAVQDTQLSPVLLEPALGEEVVDMIIADTEGQLESVFGFIVPAGKAMQSKKYDALPEALPTDEWSQVNRMIAVDVDAEGTPAALGALARDLHVDAAVVLRHEWWITRDRLDVGVAVWGYDRCTILVVGPDGSVLWRDTVVAREPSRAPWSSTFQVGFNGATWADEARTLARLTARAAWRDLRARYDEARARLPPTGAPPTTGTTSVPAPAPQERP